MKKITEEKVEKLIKVIGKGLVCGLGDPVPGEMCVMHAISVVIEGKEMDDRPTCVHSDIANFDIELNDQSWSSEKARAKGMVREAVAKLGSTKINGDKWLQDVFSSAVQLVIQQIIKKELKSIPKKEFKHFTGRHLRQFLLELSDYFKDTVNIFSDKYISILQEARKLSELYELYAIYDVLSDISGLHFAYYGFDGAGIIEFFTTYYTSKSNDGVLKALSNIAADVCVKHKTEGSKFLYLLD